MQQQTHPFPISSRVAVCGTDVVGIVQGTYYGRRGESVDVQYVTKTGEVTSRYFHSEELAPVTDIDRSTLD